MSEKVKPNRRSGQELTYDKGFFETPKEHQATGGIGLQKGKLRS